MSNRLKILVGVLIVLVIVIIGPFLTMRSGKNEAESIAQQIAESKNQTDNLRNAMRYLSRMTPLNRGHTAKEVQLELNTWILTVDRSKVQFKPTRVLDHLDPAMLDLVGCRTATELQFSEWDVDYLFERRMMNKLAGWIVEFPVRDSLFEGILEKEAGRLDDTQLRKLQEAYKLFDWVMRNVALEAELSSVEERLADPAGGMMEGGAGYGYLPWESLLFTAGDFIEKGRVFTALAAQRQIPTAWISVEGSIWAIAVLVGDEVFVFDTKLSMPILEPDQVRLATLDEARDNARVLRRLDLPGRFDYAYDPGSLKSLKLLIDLPPTAGSARMKMLESELLRDERMVLFHDLDDLTAQWQGAVSDAEVQVWQLPLQAQINAAMVRDRLSTVSEFTRQYMTIHGLWMMDNPAANGRLNHLYGRFENDDSVGTKGALSLYMDCRYDDETLRRLVDDPNVRNELGLPRLPTETLETYRVRLLQAQFVFRKAKVDASFLMAQLHFDRGDYSAAENWLRKRVLDNENPLAARWDPIARYGLARTYQELGDLEKAEEMLTYQPSPLEAGNRLRLRYLTRDEAAAAEDQAESAGADEEAEPTTSEDSGQAAAASEQDESTSGDDAADAT